MAGANLRPLCLSLRACAPAPRSPSLTTHTHPQSAQTHPRRERPAARGRPRRVLTRSPRAPRARTAKKMDATGRSIQPVKTGSAPPPSKRAARSGPRRQSRQNRDPSPPPSPVLTAVKRKSVKTGARAGPYYHPMVYIHMHSTLTVAGAR